MIRKLKRKNGYTYLARIYVNGMQISQTFKRRIDAEKWDRVYLITNEFGKEKFKGRDNVEFVVVDINAELNELRDIVYNYLKGKLKGSEVGLNFISGSGKEHMAILSAVLKLGLSIRLVGMTKNGSIVL